MARASRDAGRGKGEQPVGLQSNPAAHIIPQKRTACKGKFAQKSQKRQKKQSGEISGDDFPTGILTMRRGQIGRWREGFFYHFLVGKERLFAGVNKQEKGVDKLHKNKVAFFLHLCYTDGTVSILFKNSVCASLEAPPMKEQGLRMKSQNQPYRKPF